MLLAVRDDQPVSLVGAFERPVRPTDSGYVAESAARLLTYLAEQDEVYGTAPRLTVAAYPQWLAEAISQTKTGAEIIDGGLGVGQLVVMTAPGAAGRAG